jgi:hypothetical protein
VRFETGPIKILDHGYVSLIESWGSDERIIESARMSTQKGFQGWGTQYECAHGSLALPCTLGCLNVKERPGDEKLLGYDVEVVTLHSHAQEATRESWSDRFLPREQDHRTGDAVEQPREHGGFALSAD